MNADAWRTEMPAGMATTQVKTKANSASTMRQHQPLADELGVGALVFQRQAQIAAQRGFAPSSRYWT